MIGLHRAEMRFEPHQSGWAGLFDSYRARILDVFAGLDVMVEHVGSTAVAGLMAKPIIDIAVSLPAQVSDATYCKGFEQAGFKFWGNQGGHGGLLFVDETAPDVSACHIHVYRRNDPQWEATLCFRDVLRRNKAARSEYQRLKQNSIQLCLSRREYLESKADFVQARSRVVQNCLPVGHNIGRNRARLPGIQPFKLKDWLQRDDAFDGQMALRDRLITRQRNDVLRQSRVSKLAAQELLALVLQQLKDATGYRVEAK